MRVKIRGGAPLRGEVEVPADKSITHRALMLSALAKGRSSIRARHAGEDNQSTAHVLRSLGVAIDSAAEGWLVDGVGLAGLRAPATALDCGNSGTTMRLMAGILAGANLEATLIGDESLSRRPMDRITKALATLGARCVGTKNQGRELPPIVIAPATLHACEHTLAVASAQVKSAMLLAGLTGRVEVTINEPIPTRDHTERMLRARGAGVSVLAGATGRRITLDPPLSLTALDVDVPGDFSSAAFLVAAGSIVPNSEVVVRNVGVNPGRTGFLEILEEMGSRTRVAGWRESGGEPVGDLTVGKAELSCVQAGGQPTMVGGEDVPRMIDELVVLAAVASQAKGRLEVWDARELRVKESDRISETRRLVEAFGGTVEEWDDGFAIVGGSPLRACTLDVSSDHRIALAAAVLGLASPGETTLEGFEVAAVSYPSFVTDLRGLGADIEVLDD